MDPLAKGLEVPGAGELGEPPPLSPTRTVHVAEVATQLPGLGLLQPSAFTAFNYDVQLVASVYAFEVDANFHKRAPTFQRDFGNSRRGRSLYGKAAAGLAVANF